MNGIVCRECESLPGDGLQVIHEGYYGRDVTAVRHDVGASATSVACDFP